MLVNFIAQAVADKEYRTKHLAIAHGLRPKYFWIGTFGANFSVITISYMVCPLCIQLFDIKYLNTPAALPLIWGTTLATSAASLFWGYVVSAFFQKQATVLKVAPSIAVFLNLIPTLTVFVYLVLCLVEGGRPPNQEEQTAIAEQL